MAETTVNVNIEKKYFIGSKNLAWTDFNELSDEHKEIVIALVDKYKEEDSKTWLDKNYPKQKDYENKLCREAIKKFANELYDKYYHFSDKDYLRHVVNELGVELDKE